MAIAEGNIPKFSAAAKNETVPDLDTKQKVKNKLKALIDRFWKIMLFKKKNSALSNFKSDLKQLKTQEVGSNARFQFEKEGIRAADVTQYIQAHLLLLERYLGDLPGFVLPVVGAGIRVVLEPGEILVMQMIWAVFPLSSRVFSRIC